MGIFDSVSDEALRSMAMKAILRYDKEVSVVTNGVGELAGLRNHVYFMALECGLVEKGKTPGDDDVVRLQDIIWDFTISGLLRPGTNHPLNGVGAGILGYHYRITPFGRSVFEAVDPTPYEHDAFIQSVQTEGPVDSIALRYLDESVKVLRFECIFSSVVMLGIASERLFGGLLEIYRDALLDVSAKEEAQRQMDSIRTKNKFDYFMKEYRGRIQIAIVNDLGRFNNLTENLETIIDGIFNVIRSYRNDVGHANPVTISREEAYSHILLFRNYARKVTKLAAWLKAHPVPWLFTIEAHVK